MNSEQSPPVLLLHGFASTAEHGWGRTGWIDTLENGGRSVLAPDLPFHGDATEPQHEVWSDEVAAQLDRTLGSDVSVDAVGFSAGALVLLGMAAARPSRFRRLVLLGVGLPSLAEQETGTLASALTGAADREDVAARFWHRLAASSGNDVHRLARFLDRPQPSLDRERLARIETPTLVVVGENDPAGPAADLAAALPEGTPKSLSGLDHFGTPTDLRCLDAALAFVGT